MSRPAPRVKVSRAADPRVARVVLARPEVRNAFDDHLIVELQKAFRDLSEDPSVRVVELSGEGKVFCAGADLNWLKETQSHTLEQIRRDNAELATLFRQIDEFDRPVVGKVRGAALGGGTGLVAVCDVVVAAEGTVFGTTEVRLGIIPAVISPYVVRKIGESQARAWFLTGNRSDAAEALRVGLVHRVGPEKDLDAEAQKVVDAVLQGGPQALAEAKHLARTVAQMPPREAFSVTVQKIGERRVSPEGQEGMKAFLQQRPPSWVKGR